MMFTQLFLKLFYILSRFKNNLIIVLTFLSDL